MKNQQSRLIPLGRTAFSFLVACVVVVSSLFWTSSRMCMSGAHEQLVDFGWPVPFFEETQRVMQGDENFAGCWDVRINIPEGANLKFRFGLFVADLLLVTCFLFFFMEGITHQRMETFNKYK